MEFKSLKNIESSFRQIRLFGIVFLSLCAVITVWSVWSSYRFAERQREKIYVLDNGKSLMLALSQDLSQNRPAEAREHVRRFHELFFTLSPEKSAIEHNVKRALLLADKSVYNYYSDFAEKGYYNRIIAGNINQVLKGEAAPCGSRSTKVLPTSGRTTSTLYSSTGPCKDISRRLGRYWRNTWTRGKSAASA